MPPNLTCGAIAASMQGGREDDWCEWRQVHKLHKQGSQHILALGSSLKLAVL